MPKTPMATNRDWKEFVALLNANGVEYVIVGAIALSWHGYPRYTGDLDILVRPDPINAGKVLAALTAFGFAGLDIKESDLTSIDCIIQLGYPPGRIDIITSISGVSFDEVWAGRVAGDFGGVPAIYIGRTELLRNKLATGRAKDAGDAAELARRIPEQRS
jgi:hypothetical protein